MKQFTIFTFAFSILLFSVTSNAQTASPDKVTYIRTSSEIQNPKSLTDTITFNGLVSGTTITNQYQNKGVVFTGYAGSGNPVTYDYTGSYGSVLISDNWYNPLRVNFVDTGSGTFYHLARNIEFNNPITTEVDYISVHVYDSANVLLYHYLSTSPEHVVINLATSSAAYMVLDDSSGTAYVVDNILVDFGPTSQAGINEVQKTSFIVFPNPSNGNIAIRNENNIDEIKIENILGQTIYTTKPNQKNVSLQLAEPGLFFVKLTSGNKTKSQRVVITK